MRFRFPRKAAFAATVIIAVSAIAVNSSQSTLQFLGMSTVFGPDRGHKSGLFRQPDCSLTQLGFSPSMLMIVPATNFQDTLHQIAGLTTKADVFAKGCKDPVLGVPSTATAFLGKNASGLYQGVQGATDHVADLVAYSANPTTLTYTSTTLATNVPPQVLGVDLNKDGFVDVIATGVTDPVSHQVGVGVFMNKGDGTFKSVVVYPMTTSATASFIIDDVNGDGVPDILVPTTSAGGSGQLSVLLGKGDGTFTTGPSTPITISQPLTLLGVSQAIATGDFNGDGKTDVMTVDGKLYLGNGDGSFQSPTQALPSIYGVVTAYAVGDFNGDGKLDIAVMMTGTNPSGTIIIFLGNGDGTFKQGPAYDAVPEAVALVATDLDGDGNLDLVAARSSNGSFSAAGLGHFQTTANTWFYQVLMGYGNGTFNAPPVTLAGAAGTHVYDSNQSSYALADFYKHGKLDLLAPTMNSGVGTATALSILPGNGDGTFGAAVVSPTNISALYVTASDFNGDGNIDAAGVGSGAGGVTTVGVLFGQADGTLHAELDYPLPANSSASAIVAGDFNGDGFQDIAVAVSCSTGCTSGIYVLYGQANHTFLAPVLLSSSPSLADGATQMILAAGDLNGDSISDIVVVNAGFLSGNGLTTNGSIHVYLGKTNSTFTAISPSVPPLYFSDLSLADIDKDGKLDIVAAASDAGFNTQVDILLGHGDGTFGAATQTMIAGGIEDPAPLIAVADFDGDGHADVAFFLAGDFSGVLFGAGDGTLPTQVNMPVFSPVFPGGPRAVDLTGDGKPDLFYTDANFPSFVTMINRWSAAGAGSSPTTTALTATPSPAAAGQAVTLTATVATGGTGTPTGTVNFLDGTNIIGSSSVTAGKATLSLATLAAGTHSLTAQYSGDATFGASVSGVISLSVTAAAADFAIAASPVSGSVSAGASATSTLTLTPSGGFNATVTLSCSGLPADATCSFSQASVALGATAATSQLTIGTAARVARMIPGPRNSLDPSLPEGSVLFGMMAPFKRTRRRPRTAAVRTAGWAGLLLVCAALLSGCHSSNSGSAVSPPPSSGTPAGTYTITVTATSGSTSHATTYALTVT